MQVHSSKMSSKQANEASANFFPPSNLSARLLFGGRQPARETGWRSPERPASPSGCRAGQTKKHRGDPWTEAGERTGAQQTLASVAAALAKMLELLFWRGWLLRLHSTATLVPRK